MIGENREVIFESSISVGRFSAVLKTCVFFVSFIACFLLIDYLTPAPCCFFLFLTFIGIIQVVAPKRKRFYISDAVGGCKVKIPIDEITEIVTDSYDESGLLFILWGDKHLKVDMDLHRYGHIWTK